MTMLINKEWGKKHLNCLCISKTLKIFTLSKILGKRECKLLENNPVWKNKYSKISEESISVKRWRFNCYNKATLHQR